MQTRKLGQTGLEISQIGLGTVEIGLPYGFANNKFPTEQEAIALLHSAVDLGVTYFDTARGYDQAEERIGKSGIGKKEGIVIGTKCGQFLEKGQDPRGDELEQLIRNDITTSLRQLQTDSLQIVQLHGGSAEQINRGELIEIMQRLIDEGKVQHVGIAVRDIDAALAAINSNFFKTIQLAHSILDQRMSLHILPLAQKKSIGIINRSVFLQGSLTPKRKHLRPELSRLKQNADAADKIARNLGISLPDLAIKFVLSNSAVSVALIGTTKTRNLIRAIQAAQDNQLDQGTLSQLYPLAIDNAALVDPSKWLKD